MTPLDAQLGRVEDKLDRIIEKLDSHGQRIAVVEVQSNWAKGAIKTGLSLVLTALTGLVSVVYHLITKAGVPPHP